VFQSTSAGSHRCEPDADRDRVMLRCRIVASQSTKRNAKYDEPFTKKEMERRSRGPADIQKADACQVFKAGGSALVKLPLKLVNCMELETLPTAW
jgi:hypothetical protein